jgi:hypothetical protein
MAILFKKNFVGLVKTQIFVSSKVLRDLIMNSSHWEGFPLLHIWDVKGISET